MAEPAGFLKRSSAWTLDAVPLGLLAVALTSPWLGSRAHAVVAAVHDWNSVIAKLMVAAIRRGDAPLQFVFNLMQAPAIFTASQAFAATLWACLWPLLLAFALCSLLYHAAFEALPWRGSPGKRLLGLTVTDRNGERITLPRALLRNAAGALSWLTLNFGHLMAAMPPDKRALHDVCAGARVSMAPSRRFPTWAWWWLALVLLATLAACVLATAWWQHALDLAMQTAFGW